MTTILLYSSYRALYVLVAADFVIFWNTWFMENLLHNCDKTSRYHEAPKVDISIIIIVIFMN